MKYISLSQNDEQNLLNSLPDCDLDSIQWQEPVITEKIVSINKSKIICPKKFTYLEIPWATLLDIHNLHEKHFEFDVWFLSHTDLINIEEGFAVCQSIHYKKLLPLFAQLNINVFFATHVTKNEKIEAKRKWGILLENFIHYPVNYKIGLDDRKYLYSFIGAKNTNKKRQLLELLSGDNGYIRFRESWHFQQSVYGEQMGIKESFSVKNTELENEYIEYRDVLSESTFSICPSGSGPNTIRLWESIFSGAIPIVLGEKLDLSSFGLEDSWYIHEDWDNVKLIPEKLRSISEEEVFKMKTNCLEIRSSIEDSYFVGSINNFFKKKNILERLQEVKIDSNFYQEEGFHLIVSMYYEGNQKRLNEYRVCFEENILNKSINKIHVFIEHDTKQCLRLITQFDFLKSHKVVIIPFLSNKKRNVSYKDMVDYANNRLNGKDVIFANADIYFDESIRLAMKFNLSNSVLALTRWNKEEYLDRNAQIWKRHSWSQDSWVFRAPLDCNCNDIKLGWIKCDNRFAYELNEKGYKVLNPSETIKTWHVHENTSQDELYRDKYISAGENIMEVVMESLQNALTQRKDKYSVLNTVFSKLNNQLWNAPSFSKYVVLCEGRTGSNYLRSLLNGSPFIQDHGEVFNPNKNMIIEKEYIKRHGWESYFYSHFMVCDDILASGIKLKYDQLSLMRSDSRKTNRNLMELLLQRTDIKIIHLKRKNLLNLLVSRKIAKSTGQWMLTDEKNRVNSKTMHINLNQCLNSFKQIEYKQDLVEKRFVNHEKIDVYYEDLVQNPTGTVKTILNFLHHEIPLYEIKSHVLKQNKQSLDEIIDNYNELKEYFDLTEWNRFFV
jgi:LPS sulfotransferase NodH